MRHQSWYASDGGILAWLVTMANGMESDLEGLEYLHAGLLVIEYNQIKSPQHKCVATSGLKCTFL